MSAARNAQARADWNIPDRVTVLVLSACWFAVLAEGYDIGVLGAVLPALAEYEPWGLSPMELGGLGSYALIGMLIGALFIGQLSDLIGRRRVLLFAFVIYNASALGVALAPTPEVFGIFRFIGGLGMGGLIPIAAAMTIEFSPPWRRSLNYTLMFSAYSFGIVVAALVALVTFTNSDDPEMWRWVVGIGAVPIVFLPVIAKMLPESLEYQVNKGQIDQARAQAEKLGIRPFDPDTIRIAESEKVSEVPWRQVLAAIFSPKFLRSTILFWVALFCGLLLVYGLNTWLPSIMREAGYDLGGSLTFLLVFSLSAGFGGLALGWAADRFGRRPVLAIFYVLGGLGVILLMMDYPFWVNMILVGFAGLGAIGTSAILTGYITDFYPPNARATAAGWALSFARVGAIMGPILGGWIAASALGFAWNFYIFAAVAGMAALCLAGIPREKPTATAIEVEAGTTVNPEQHRQGAGS
ncbi:MFS transporter [Nesterenkonia marinintestina]|uniref:MFS transporter n=1 Tax=Nesterenkonia marinintestina TaxID=2979865 RepID=UPI0021C12ED2|nr:aromatic acid/H+ symport family MFS transporter [Nesterenkonia sp. GX14115]